MSKEKAQRLIREIFAIADNDEPNDGRGGFSKITRLATQADTELEKQQDLEAENKAVKENRETYRTANELLISKNNQLQAENKRLKTIETIARTLLNEIHEDIFIKLPRGQVIKGEVVTLTRATKLLAIMDKLRDLFEE